MKTRHTSGCLNGQPFIFLFFFCLSAPAALLGQTFDRWAQVVGWDGVSHWSRYLITQPAYTGPNALPVPRVGNGDVDSNSYFAISGNLHFSPGDQTQNLTVYAQHSLVKDLLTFDLMWVPYERYRMSTAIKEKRHVFSQFFYDREATGELHLNTNIRLLRKWSHIIRLAFRLGYRFPSGSGYGAARYTDAPGYYLDLSFGKPLGNSPFTWTGMLGFYSWQLESDRHRQNDAFLFGTGLEWNRNNWRVQTNLAGYLGYLYESGDKPIVFRVQAERRWKGSSCWLGFQQGLQDFAYSSTEAGWRYFIFPGKRKQ